MQQCKIIWKQYHYNYLNICTALNNNTLEFQSYSNNHQMSSTYHAERKSLQMQNGTLHYELWLLGKEREIEDQLFHLKTEVDENAMSISALYYLMDNNTTGKVNDTTSDNSEDRPNNHIQCLIMELLVLGNLCYDCCLDSTKGRSKL